MRFLLILLFQLYFSYSFSANYYFAANGDDSNSGKSKNRPLKTITRLNSIKLSPGDSVLFRRGDTFVGEIIIKSSGSNKKPIVFAAYGQGKLPIITGAVKLTQKSVQAGGLSVFAVANKIHRLFIDGNTATLARYPNNGYLKVISGNKNAGFNTGLEIGRASCRERV